MIRRIAARRAILWGLVALLALMVVEGVAIEWLHPQLYDVEHVTRMNLLRERLSENPQRPVCLALGTSRLGLALLPERLPVYQTADEREVLTFNFSHLGSAPAMHLMQLHRLFREGIRPEWIIIDLVPIHLVPRDDNFVSYHVSARDVMVLTPYMQPRKLHGRYLKRMIEMSPRYPAYLLGFDPEPRFPLDYLGGYRDLVEKVDTATREQKTEVTRKLMAEHSMNFQVSPRPARLLRECVNLCHKHGVKVGIILMPEGSKMRSWYSKDATRHLHAFLAEFKAKGVAVYDATTWLDDRDFYDEHHVLRCGAEKFTERFGREVLEPFLSGKPSLEARKP